MAEQTDRLMARATAQNVKTFTGTMTQVSFIDVSAGTHVNLRSSKIRFDQIITKRTSRVDYTAQTIEAIVTDPYQ